MRPMSDLSHLADKFRSKLGLLSAQSERPIYPSAAPSQYKEGGFYGGPLIPTHHYASTPGGQWTPTTPPPVPPRPSLSPYPDSFATFPTLSVEALSQGPSAGAIYAPGAYPTPELPLYPLQKSRILNPSHEHEYTSSTIQEVLNELGPSATLYLKPGTTWRIHSPIKMQEFQEIATLGYPTAHHEMAVLDAQEDCRPHIIHAFEKSGVRIRNLIIEGNQHKYGFDKQGGVMIQLGGGGAKNQARQFFRSDSQAH